MSYVRKVLGKMFHTCIQIYIYSVSHDTGILCTTSAVWGFNVCLLCGFLWFIVYGLYIKLSMLSLHQIIWFILNIKSCNNFILILQKMIGRISTNVFLKDKCKNKSLQIILFLPKPLSSFWPDNCSVWLYT